MLRGAIAGITLIKGGAAAALFPTLIPGLGIAYGAAIVGVGVGACATAAVISAYDGLTAQGAINDWSPVLEEIMRQQRALDNLQTLVSELDERLAAEVRARGKEQQEKWLLILGLS